MNARISDIQRFSNRDGPGIRAVMFFAGCPLSCAWCHNPETQSMEPRLLFSEKSCVLCGACEGACPHGVHQVLQTHRLNREACTFCGACCENCPTGALSLSNKKMDTTDILREVLRDRVFYGKEGGITLSGGEPLLQLEAAAKLLQQAKQEGISTAVETCGFVETTAFEKIAPWTDLLLFDVKDTDSTRHRQYTGQGNERILENLFYADGLGIPTRLRCILVKGVNTEPAHYLALRELRNRLHACTGIDLLPYHTFGSDKSLQLGREPDARLDWIPTPEDMEQARQTLADG